MVLTFLVTRWCDRRLAVRYAAQMHKSDGHDQVSLVANDAAQSSNNNAWAVTAEAPAEALAWNEA